jgi:hypothetical protein
LYVKIKKCQKLLLLWLCWPMGPMVLVYLVAPRGWRAGPNCQGWIIDKKHPPCAESGNRAPNLHLERQNMPTGLALFAVIYGLLRLFNPSCRSKSSSSSGRGPVRKIWPWWLPRLCAPTRRRRRRGETKSPVQPQCAGGESELDRSFAGGGHQIYADGGGRIWPPELDRERLMRSSQVEGKSDISHL